MTHTKDYLKSFCSVYGPTQSWRFGRSLGIDPIGPIPTCPFRCVYCQLGEIHHQTSQRKIYVPTEQIAQDLITAKLHQSIDHESIDVVTLSGSGEPTLAENLGDILKVAKEITDRPTVVLTSSVLLGQPEVRDALQSADRVAAKLDAVCPEQLQRVNRPLNGIHLSRLLTGLQQFRQDYSGYFAIQTMILAPWSLQEQDTYIQVIQQLQPDEVQFNIPSRPRAIAHQIEYRGNEGIETPSACRQMKCVSFNFLQSFSSKVQHATGIPTRFPSSASA